MALVTNRLLIMNHMFGPCEKFKLDITKWLLSVRQPFLISEMVGNFAEMYSASYGCWLVSAQAHETQSTFLQLWFVPRWMVPKKCCCSLSASLKSHGALGA